MVENSQANSPDKEGKKSRLARLLRLGALFRRDRNLRSLVRALIYTVGEIDEVSPVEFASNITAWKETLALLQEYHNPHRTTSSEALFELYPELENQITKEISAWESPATIAILIPVFNFNLQILEKSLRSVERQFYSNLVVCLLTDRLAETQTRELAREIFGSNANVEIRVHDALERNLEVALNAALGETRGDFLAFLSPGDRLKRNALFEVMRLINQQSGADLIYSDEEQESSEGFISSFHKPGWSADLCLSLNYLRNFLCCRIDGVRSAGGFRGYREEDIKYDLVLRMMGLNANIHHIPQVLYTESLPKDRVSPGDPALKLTTQALNAYLEEKGISAEVGEGLFPGSFRARRKILTDPKVTIIIPTKDTVDLLRQCLESMELRTTYRNLEIIVVDNGSTDPATLDYLDKLSHKVLRYPGPFNFSAINNMAAREASGSHLVFLNDDTQVIAAEWIEAMLEHSQREEVGAVGAKLIYPNGTIQHAGIGLDRRRIAVHLNRFRGSWEHGHHGLMDVVRNLNAVTGACLMTSADRFHEVGGFEERLPVLYNDVDLCLKMRKRGYLVVYTPFALLYHHEGVRTRMTEVLEIEGSDFGWRWTHRLGVTPGQAEEVNRFYSRWRDFIENDDYYIADELTDGTRA